MNRLEGWIKGREEENASGDFACVKSEEEGKRCRQRPLHQKVDAQTLRPLPRNKESISRGICIGYFK